MRASCALLLLLFACSNWRETEIADGTEAWQKVASNDETIPSGDPGIQLFLREKRPRDGGRIDRNHVVLYVHGGTYPAETTFDLEVSSLSWMDYIAERGYDVWLVDIRGYGRSTRPPEMNEPPQANAPVVRTDVAMHDVSAAIDHILEKRGTDGLCLMGFSWGATIAATYAVDHPAKVQKLILYAPQWLGSTAKVARVEAAYRIVTVASAHERWLAGVPEPFRKDLIPPGWFPAWADTTFATDPVGSQQSPRTLRVPNGSIADTRDFWAAGKPLYDPSGIAAPTLVVNAEWAQDWPASASYALFQRLGDAPYRRLVLIGEGTQMIMLERNRMQLFREVQAFLDEPQRIQDEEPQPPPAWRLIPGAGRVGLD